MRFSFWFPLRVILQEFEMLYFLPYSLSPEASLRFAHLLDPFSSHVRVPSWLSPNLQEYDSPPSPNLLRHFSFPFRLPPYPLLFPRASHSSFESRSRIAFPRCHRQKLCFLASPNRLRLFSLYLRSFNLSMRRRLRSIFFDPS